MPHLCLLSVLNLLTWQNVLVKKLRFAVCFNIEYSMRYYMYLFIYML